MSLAEKVTRFMFDLQRRHSGLRRREIEIPGGLRYVYLEGGRGEPLLLLHGFGADKDHFTRVARFLTPHYRLIVPDHIGFGQSSHPQDADYAAPAQAARLRAFMRALGIERFHLGGSSMGGQISPPTPRSSRPTSPACGCSIRRACGAHRKASARRSSKRAAQTRSWPGTKRNSPRSPLSS